MREELDLNGMICILFKVVIKKEFENEDMSLDSDENDCYYDSDYNVWWFGDYLLDSDMLVFRVDRGLEDEMMRIGYIDIYEGSYKKI